MNEQPARKQDAKDKYLDPGAHRHTIFGVEWLVVFPVGFLSGLLPALLLLFHAAVAVDTWMIAQRLQVGQKVRKWEWCWQ